MYSEGEAENKREPNISNISNRKVFEINQIRYIPRRNEPKKFSILLGPTVIKTQRY